jgi:hypothetical protein
MILELPDEVSKHLPQGHEPTPGVKLVLPMRGAHGIAAVNEWLRAEDWYPSSLENVVWFGDDGTGNYFGWKPKERAAILWNPEDGETPWKEGSVEELWVFVPNNYTDPT